MNSQEGDGRIALDAAPMTAAFFEMWSAAGRHLDQWSDRGLTWLRAHPNPPYMEHLSFRFGNQLYFVRVVDAAGRIEGPGTLGGLRRVSLGNRGHGCLLPMIHSANEWTPLRLGWGLVSPGDGRPLNPEELATDAIIEMSPWEIHDLAVQVARQHLQDEGMEIITYDSDPEVEPAVWVRDRDGRPAWVIVRAACHPAPRPEPPEGWRQLAGQFGGTNYRGYFAPVGLANAEDPFHPAGKGALPLWRGHECRARLDRLERIHDP